MVSSQRFRAKKSLGQHFLVDLNVVDKIIAALDLKDNDIVLEIGPGKGILTESILPEVKKVIAVEKDNQLSEELARRFGTNVNFELVRADFLDWNLSRLQHFKIKVVGNLPYNQSKPILRRLLESQLNVELVVLMLQREVAEKILNPIKNNLFSLMISVFAKAEKIILVKPNAFVPQPKVDSLIIKLVPYQKPLIIKEDQLQFFALIKKAFRFPRKKLLNNLPELREVDLTRIGLNPNVRAEDLRLDQWIELLRLSR